MSRLLTTFMMNHFQAIIRIGAVTIVALSGLVGLSRVHAADANYHEVTNWAQFPPDYKWGEATGVDVDSQDNVYIATRNQPLTPVVVFSSNGQFLRSWGKNAVGSAHYLRIDSADHVWLTDRGHFQIFEYDREGKLLREIGTKDVTGDNASETGFNGVADVAFSKSGDIFIADGEGPNTRIVKLSKDGKFLKWWGGKGSESGQFNTPHGIAIDAADRVYVADRNNRRIQIFSTDGAFLGQWTNFGQPSGLYIKGNLIYVVDGSANNCVYIANLKDGQIIDKIEGLKNPTALTIDSKGNVYIAEILGDNVRKFVKQ